jgi:hypothetical protein
VEDAQLEAAVAEQVAKAQANSGAIGCLSFQSIVPVEFANGAGTRGWLSGFQVERAWGSH